MSKKKNLGGVLRDYELKNDFFFRGCQYLENDIKWLDEFKKKYQQKISIILNIIMHQIIRSIKKTLLKKILLYQFLK